MPDFETIALRLRDMLVEQLKHVLSFRFLFSLLRSSWVRICSIGVSNTNVVSVTDAEIKIHSRSKSLDILQTGLGTLYLIQYICYAFRKTIISQTLLLCENVSCIRFFVIANESHLGNSTASSNLFA